jgi:hypothetical protein
VASAVALPVYGLLLAGAGIAVWKQPRLALYAFVAGLAVHNLVMAVLWGAGVRGNALEAVAAWKEGLLAVAVARVAFDSVRGRRLPFRPGPVDGLALAFGAIVVLYAILPQGPLGGHAGLKAVLYGLRHDLAPVAAYLVGRSLGLGRAEGRRLAWTLLAAAAALAVFGLVEEYTVPVEWWHRSGAVGYFRQLGFDYHGPGGMPENFAFNASHHVYRRLISTFVSPLATGYLLVVALLLAPRRRLVAPLAAVAFAGLLFTISRSALAGLAIGLVVLALLRRQAWPLAAAALTVAVGVGFDYGFTHIAPRTHFLKADLKYQQQYARTHPGATRNVFSLNEPSLRSHLTSLADGLRTVADHPQGYGLGNAGATASRTKTPIRAGESNYTEIGVETGLAGLTLFVAWNLALLLWLARSAWAGDPRSAAVAAALAAVLAVAVQTDAYGIPWLGYCLWWAAGAMLVPIPRSASSRVLSPATEHP